MYNSHEVACGLSTGIFSFDLVLFCRSGSKSCISQLLISHRRWQIGGNIYIANEYRESCGNSIGIFTFDIVPFERTRSTSYTFRMQISRKWWHIGQTLLLPTNIKLYTVFPLAYLHLTLAYSIEIENRKLRLIFRLAYSIDQSGSWNGASTNMLAFLFLRWDFLKTSYNIAQLFFKILHLNNCSRRLCKIKVCKLVYSFEMELETIEYYNVYGRTLRKPRKSGIGLKKKRHVHESWQKKFGWQFLQLIHQYPRSSVSTSHYQNFTVFFLNWAITAERKSVIFGKC